MDFIQAKKAKDKKTKSKTLLVVTGREGRFADAMTMRFTFSHPTNHTSAKELVGGYRTGVHLFPFRTEKLSPVPPMILGSSQGK